MQDCSGRISRVPRVDLALETITEPAALGPAREEWDALVERLSKPYCLSAWLLAWWEHVAPNDAQLRLIIIRERESGALVGVAPFYAFRRRGLTHYSLMASDLSPQVEPIVAPEHVDQASKQLAQALATAMPRPDVIELEGVPADSRWVERLTSNWPKRKPYVYRRPGEGAPSVPLTVEDLDAWFKARSSNFRHQMRRFRRRADEAGGVFRATENPDDLKRDLAEFERLHRGRWEWRGGSDAFPPGTDTMLEQAGREMMSTGRFRLSLMEIEGKAITGMLFLAAGEEMTVWATGFDDDYAHLRPSYLTLVDGLDTAFKGGFKRFDLGAGTQPYKKRFADDEDALEWVSLIPPGPRYALARAAIAPEQTRFAITTRLTPEQKQKIKSLPDRARQKLRREPSPS
jgi:CelD/BcsL family acetyltransferase involved in cellulose biosynthesis